MSTLPFAHLHCHSHYSLLDGAGTIRGLLERAKALRMNALALTDHGNLHGAVKFYQTAKELGINPIIGLEAYIAPGSRFRKESAGSSKEANFHLTLLARNATGFRNLVKLSSAAFLEGFYFRPRIDKELLGAHREGLICLSGCVSSELNRTLLAGGEANMEKAVEMPPGIGSCSATITTSKSRTTAFSRSKWRWQGRCRWPTGWAFPWWPPATSTTSTARTPRLKTFCCA